MPGPTPIRLSREARNAIVQLYRNDVIMFGERERMRGRLEYIDREYVRENLYNTDSVRAEIANAYGDKYRLQNITVPLVMPQIETSVGYLTDVFLTGNPIFAFSAEPKKEDVSLMYNTILADQQTRGGWIAEFIKFFRNGYKYNVHAVEVAWSEEKTYDIATDIRAATDGKPVNEAIWAGNKIRNLDLYNTFWDLRVEPHKLHSEGEFAGYVETYSRIGFEKFLESLPTYYKDQLKDMRTTGVGGQIDYFIPDIVRDPVVRTKSQRNWWNWVNDTHTAIRGENFQQSYEIATMYRRIIPADLHMAVPSASKVQIWKFIIINRQYVLYAERLTNAHDVLPIIMGQIYNDGLGIQSKSPAANLIPFQDMTSALWNAIINSARRSVTDRVLYNPNMVREADINSPEPNAKIPVRNAVYGRPLQEAVFQFPFDNSNTQYYMQQAQQVLEWSYLAHGTNRARQGQFQKGNKTLVEFERTMSNSDARDMMAALFIEAQTLTPIKTILKYNILQYQPNGEVYNRELQQPVKIDRAVIQTTAADFQISDGLSPVSKEMGTEEFAVALQTLQASPQLGAGYNIVPMFSYMMKLRGLKHLDEFEKSPLQIQYESAVQSWQAVAEVAAKAGQPVPPQPPMPPELIQELQQKAAQQQAQQVQPSSPPTPSSAASGAALAPNSSGTLPSPAGQ